MQRQTIHYGEPCFQQGGTRGFDIFSNERGVTVYYRTVYTQGMVEGDNADDIILSLYETLKDKLKGEDKKLFKHYFNSL